MDFDFELEDILNSIKEERASAEAKENPSSEAHPQPAEPLAPPKPKTNFMPEETTAPEKAPKKKREPGERVKLNFALPEPIKKVTDRAAAALRKIPLKKVGLGAGILLLAVLLIIGGVKLINYGKTAYIHKYEKQYGITYPTGIRKDFCDDYGKDQTYAGILSIEDTATEKKVYGSADITKNAVMKKGSTVLEEQEVRSIALDKAYADLEKVYGTPEGFKKASQKVTFDTLFEKETYRVVAAFYTNTKAEDDDGYIFPYCTYGNLTEKSFKAFEDRIKNRRLYDTGFQILKEHRILTLSVPSDFMKDFKFVVVCVKTKDSFKKSRTAEPNKTIHYPEVWYTQNKQKNPFFLAGKWYPEIITNEEKGETQQLTIEDFDFS